MGVNATFVENWFIHFFAVLQKARPWNHGIFGGRTFPGLGKPLGPCSLSVCKCMERRRVEKTSIKSP